jgi:hypothetical protein
MYPHSNSDSINSRFSISERYKELAGKNRHRTGQDTEEAPEWESSFQMNMSNSTLDRILNEAPANKKYALIPWMVVDQYDRKAAPSKAMINLHRQNGYTIVPSARHRQSTLVSDRIYKQIDNYSFRDKKSSEEEILYDEAIIIGENIIMEHNKEEFNRYSNALSEESKSTYREIGPNGLANNPEVNPRLLGMTYTTESQMQSQNHAMGYNQGATINSGTRAPQQYGY